MSLVELTVPVNFLRLSKKLFEINLDFPTGPAQHCPTDSKAKESYFGTFEDPECPVVHSAGSGLFVAVYCITACAIIFTLLHAIHRRHRFRREARSLGGADAEAGRRDGALMIAFGEDMQAQGFQSSRLGSVALVALGCFYAQWLGLYLVVLVDYYWECELTGLNNMCFYGSYPVFGSYNRNSTVLFGTWLCSLAAYSHLLIYSARLRNFYRLPCAVAVAQHVAILLPPEADAIVVPRPRWLVRQQRRLKARLGESRPRRWHTASLHRAASGAAYVEFRCARYVLRDGRFVRAEAALVGTTLSSLVAGEAGLGEERRAALLSEVGPNRIAFDVDPLGVALRKEFFSYFYLYQFQLYVVWLWFSYVFVALALISVVLLAGLANVAIARTNQRKIAALTRSATRCRVRVRDEWLTVTPTRTLYTLTLPLTLSLTLTLTLPLTLPLTLTRCPRATSCPATSYRCAAATGCSPRISSSSRAALWSTSRLSPASRCPCASCLRTSRAARAASCTPPACTASTRCAPAPRCCRPRAAAAAGRRTAA